MDDGVFWVAFFVIVVAVVAARASQWRVGDRRDNE
jgi:hypothetical protein